MEKYTKTIETQLEGIKDAWKKEVEKFCEDEKLLQSENKAHKLKIIELEKQNTSLKNVIATQKTKLEAQEKTIRPLQDKNQAQKIEIDFIHKKLEGQQLQIDILEAEKKSLDARFNEVNLKLKQQRQASHGEIPPLIPDQVEKMKVDYNPLSFGAQPEKDVKNEQSYSVPLVNTPQSTAPQPSQAKNLKRPADQASVGRPKIARPLPVFVPEQLRTKIQKFAEYPRTSCPVQQAPAADTETETETKNPPSNGEEKRYVCSLCLKDWYQHNSLQAPRNIVKSFTTRSRLHNHVRQFHPDNTGLKSRDAGTSCDSDCPLTIATGETKPKKFKCNALTRDGHCHERFKCRLHYDRHIEIDHANISALDKYSLADLYEKHLKK